MNGLDRMTAVAATEFRLAFRNRWVLLSTLAFTLFALALAFLGSGPSGALKVDALTLTAASLSTLTVYLVPLMALLVSYDSIAGEIERGTLALVLATPVKRGELVLAKFCGHLAVLTLAIAVGYGIAGLVIAAVHGANPAGLVAWGRLVATAVLLGAVFVALGMMLSGLPRQTGTAAAMAIGAWLVLVVLYDLALLGAVIVDQGGTFTKSIFPALVLANPGDAFRLYNLALIESNAPIAGLDGLAHTLPFPVSSALVVLALWLFAGLAGAWALTRRIRP
jgi:Cu-processing system permease protein